MWADRGTDAQLLQVRGAGPGLVALLLLLRLVLEAAVVEDLADRGARLGCHLDQVEPRLSCLRARVVRRDDAELVALLVDQPHLGDADPVVAAELGPGCGLGATA